MKAQAAQESYARHGIQHAHATSRPDRLHGAAPTLDPYYHILEQITAGHMHATVAALKRCQSRMVLPILAACSGHLLDEHDQAQTPRAHADAYHCAVCDEHVAPETDLVTERTRAWRRMWHSLIDCPANHARRAALTAYTHEMLQAAVPESPYYEALATLFEDVRGDQVSDCVKSRFFELITNPAGYVSPQLASMLPYSSLPRATCWPWTRQRRNHNMTNTTTTTSQAT